MFSAGVFSGFEPNPTVAVALSGGADSMALAHLAKAWLEPLGGKVIALTVDHKLRPESSIEATLVAERMKQLGIDHYILTLTETIEGNIQSQARKLRYEVLEDWCKNHQVLHLMTAHHADDVEETLAMRMWRGSGIEGLAGIPSIRYGKYTRILRPLLAIRKHALIEYLIAHDILWVEDPSNATDDYERNVVRRQLDEHPLEEFHASRFAFNMAFTKNLIETEAARLLATSLQLHDDGTATLDAKRWMLVTKPVMRHAFARLIMFLSGAETAPRGHELKQLMAQFTKDETSTITLGGLLFERSQKKQQSHLWHICREPSRIASRLWNDALPNLWDARFMLSFSEPQITSLAPLTCKPLSAEGLARLQSERVQFPTHLSYAGKLGLLSLWNLDQLLSVPHISYWNTEAAPQLKEQLTICFLPAVSLTESASHYPSLS